MEDDGVEHAPISLPDDQYEWEVENDEIGSVGADGKFCSRVTEGHTGVEVQDVTMRNNTAEGGIHVVYPWRLEVKLRDVTAKYEEVHEDHLAFGEDGMDDKFAEALFDISKLEEDAESMHILIEEHYYLIEMFLYEKRGNLITLTENLRFVSLNLDERYFEIVRTNTLGTELVFKTKNITTESKRIDTIHKLKEIRSMCSSEHYTDFKPDRLAVDKELVITKPVKIQHPTDLILLPFLPIAQEQHGSGEIWRTWATGGSGAYSWAMVDQLIATVEGSAVVQSVKPGKTVLVVRDLRNWYNRDAINVEVAVINQLAWIEEQSEIAAAPSELEEVALR